MKRSVHLPNFPAKKSAMESPILMEKRNERMRKLHGSWLQFVKCFHSPTAHIILQGIIRPSKNTYYSCSHLLSRSRARILNGRGGIRTHEDLSALTVFKTVAFDRSATLPLSRRVGTVAEYHIRHKTPNLGKFFRKFFR